VTRRGYLDWLRGLAVVIMIEAHTLDAWTRAADRSSTYGWAMVLAGYGGPYFMFLAGLGMALSAGSCERRGLAPAQIASRARMRGLQIFGLAFLFRFQSWLVSGGPLRSMLKVDILNVMGISMMVAGLLWGWGRSRWSRAVLLGAAALACTMATPLIRGTPLLDAVPGPIESYLRPIPGRTTFTLFPWAGFLFAGGAAGLVLDAVRTADAERRACVRLGMLGLALGVGGYAASFLPSIYPSSEYWTSSPTYFFVRLGVLLLSVPLAYLWVQHTPGWSPLVDFGRSSLFVYWVHVELVYGVVSRPLHRALPFPAAILAFVVFTVLMLVLVKAKERVVRRWQEGAGDAGLPAASAG
jgi:uncharacterized membrane protein